MPAGTCIKQGFIGNDKVPFFSAAMLSESNIERINENQYRLKKKFVQYMMQLGNYAVWFKQKRVYRKS